MIVDTSALLELFAVRTQTREIAATLIDADSAKTSAVCVLETASILRQTDGPDSVERFLTFLIQQKIKIIPFDGDQLLAALLGDASYSAKGADQTNRNLRLAELATYGLAKHLGEAVLHSNAKLASTDIVSARNDGL